MNSFLTKISQLPSIQKVLFLSTRGDVLFLHDNSEVGEKAEHVSPWHAIIDQLHSPVEAELFFEQGGYYLHSTEIGYLIVGMNGFDRLQNIKAACTQLKAKLSDSTICKKVLLRMLQDADDTHKPQFIMALLPFADEEIAEKLIALLGRNAQVIPQISAKLVGNICQVLGQSASPAARQVLKKILQDHYSGKTVLDNEVRYAAQVAVAQLELALPPETSTASPGTDNPVAKALPETKPPLAASSSLPKSYAAQVPEGPKIEDLLHQGKKGDAIALMLAQIEICAHKKQFDMAEHLRDWILQADSTALREIILAAEIIEEQKNLSISDAYRAVWAKLAGKLSTEEFSSLYHAMVHKHYKTGEIVVDQGQFVSTLFFIDRGKVQLFSASHGGEYALKTLDAGEIFGAETFFDISIWTMSARSLGADISQLTWDRLLSLKESCPAIRTKLMDYCNQFKLTNITFDKPGTTRRRFERVKISGKVAVALVKNIGEESLFGTKGNLIDISRGGLAFSLRFSKKKNAVALLGQDVNVTVRTDLSPHSVQRKGVIKAVQCHDFVGNDYTIHMEFQETLSSAEVSQAIGRIR
ncbi:cyclic nucleotide-binding domain-containing protein [Desulfopila sp. IMCC35006]|nr:cyclic nucleotide-binding domain-containing protein [Desulfopila sp. IMCC35006]